MTIAQDIIQSYDELFFKNSPTKLKTASQIFFLANTWLHGLLEIRFETTSDPNVNFKEMFKSIVLESRTAISIGGT